MSEEHGPTFRPEDLEQWLTETPKPLVIDVEPLRLCSEQTELLHHEVLRIVEKTLHHIRPLLTTLPIGRHVRLVTLQKLPGTFALQTQQTPWGRGAGQLYQSLRSCIAQALTESGIFTELVPADVAEPEAPADPHSRLSVDIIIEDDEESRVILSPPDAEETEEGEIPPGSLAFYERSLFHIYGTKWRD